MTCNSSFGQVAAAKEKVIVFEAESTKSRLGKWKLVKNVPGFQGKGYLEFTGNEVLSGKPNSPLKYKFKVAKGGLYFLHIRCAKEHVKWKGKLRTDIANDCFVRLEGRFGAGKNVTKKHGGDAALKDLKSNNKFFGGEDKKFVWTGGNRLDLGGHQNKRVAVYDLKGGKEYTLVISGRSKKFKIDTIALRHESINKNFFSKNR